MALSACQQAVFQSAHLPYNALYVINLKTEAVMRIRICHPVCWAGAIDFLSCTVEVGFDGWTRTLQRCTLRIANVQEPNPVQLQDRICTYCNEDVYHWLLVSHYFHPALGNEQQFLNM